MHLKSTLVLFLAILYSQLHAQVTVLGKFAIGDSTSLQILHTHRGDQFQGWVSSWTADSIVFSTKNSLQFSFPVEAVMSVEVGSDSSVGDLATEIFVMRTKEGGTYYGYPTKITEKIILFDASKAGYMRLKPNEVLSMEPMVATLVSRQPYVNEYTVNSKIEHIPNGRLVSFKNGTISHIDAKGDLYQTNTFDLKKYKLTPQHLPYSGHGRSLMFAQTGFGMKPKEREYRNIMVGINIFSYGLSENLSIAGGLISFFPYVDIKVSKSLGKYVHLSGGGYGFLPFSAGLHGAVSLGTPNYFLNIGYNKNFENKAIYSQIEFEDFNCGASVKVGRRARVFAEYHIITSAFDDDDYYGYSTFSNTGFANSFSWGYGWYNSRFRFETGVMQTGPYESWSCFSRFSSNTNPCRDYYHVPVPFLSMAINFRR